MFSTPLFLVQHLPFVGSLNSKVVFLLPSNVASGTTVPREAAVETRHHNETTASSAMANGPPVFTVRSEVGPGSSLEEKGPGKG